MWTMCPQHPSRRLVVTSSRLLFLQPSLIRGRRRRNCVRAQVGAVWA